MADREHLARVLSRPQLAGIGISGCIGAGLFINSGSLISTTGSLGAAISYAVAGFINACVFYTVTEMVACRPLAGALIDLPHRFLHPACGFTVASLYIIGEICVIANLTALAAEQTSLLKDSQTPHSVGAEAGVNLALILLTTFSHCLGVKLYGKIERVIMWFKLSLLALVCVAMVVLNLSGGHPEDSPYDANYTTNAFTPGWKPTGFRTTRPIQLSLAASSTENFGLSGAGGRLFAFITSVCLAMFSCFGSDLIAMTAGEAKHPWKDIPITMSFVYLVPLSLYPFVMFAGGANVNYADPDLPKIWRTPGGITKSPFIIAAENSSLHALPKVLCAFFIISAYTSANTYLYAASRNVFTFSQQYLPARVGNIFGRTDSDHTPLAAILFCSALGLLSLIGLIDRNSSQPQVTLSEIYTGTATCVNLCQCITFLRFKAGLDRLKERKIFGRNDALYAKYLFKSRWQPLPAYIGIIGCAFVVAWTGVTPILLLIAKRRLTASLPDNPGLKSTTDLVVDVFGAYIGPILFATLFISYKLIHPHTSHVDSRTLTVGDYVLEDLSKSVLDDTPSEPPIHQPLGLYELPTRDDSPSILSGPPAFAPRRESIPLSGEWTEEMQERKEIEEARREEHERARHILILRGPRMERGFWREAWSFVVTDREGE